MIELQNAGIRFGARWIFRGLDLNVDQGGCLAILGPNGRGKTTLIRAILGIQRLDEGYRSAPNVMGFVPQISCTPPPYRVIEMVVMGRSKAIGIFGVPSIDDYRASEEALEMVGMRRLRDQSFASLSGGERQLVLVARALATGATTIVLDEPSSALDLANQGRLLSIIETLTSNPEFTIVFSTHQPQHVLHVADAVLMMMDDRLETGRPDAVMSEANLSALYRVDVRRVALPGGTDAVTPFLASPHYLSRPRRPTPVGGIDPNGIVDQ